MLNTVDCFSSRPATYKLHILLIPMHDSWTAASMLLSFTANGDTYKSTAKRYQCEIISQKICPFSIARTRVSSLTSSATMKLAISVY